MLPFDVSRDPAVCEQRARVWVVPPNPAVVSGIHQPGERAQKLLAMGMLLCCSR